MNINTLLQVTVPKDIPLPLPLPEGILISILVISFLLHILFINLMVGGSILTFWYQIKGLKNKDYDTLAREIAQTITINKSVAVVLGVAPLLSINVLYTVYFYSANALTGNMWISIVPWVAVSFLVLYLHKYTWDKFANNRSFHISILGVAVASFLFIPFIFLANINLMLYPERWNEMHGFFSALTIPNVFPRYFHFIAASLAVTGLFLFVWLGGKRFSTEGKFRSLTKNDLKRKSLNLALAASGTQLILGPLLFLTLPSKGISWSLFWVISTGVIFACIAIYWMWKSLTGQTEQMSKRIGWIISAITVTVLMMGTGRHIYRENALSTPKKLMAERTSEHWKLVEKAHQDLLIPKEVKEVITSPGQSLFQNNCTVCHTATTRLVGPPMAELAPLYKENISGLKAWIKQPGRKRADYPQMTGFPQLSDEQLTELANFVLQNNWK